MTPPTSTSARPSEGPIAVLAAANRDLRRFTLENGMTCLVKEERSAPVASVQFWVGTGAIHEEEYLGGGLSHYVEHMIFKGTPTRSPSDVVRDITGAGGEVNAYTAHDRTVFYTTIPAARWQVGFEVLADAMMHAHFPEDEWEREKNVIVREMDMGRDDPDRVAGKLLYQNAYRVHPLQHPVIGYEDVFLSLTREDLLDFFQRHYVPDNMMLVVVGDVDAAEVETTIRETLAGFKRERRAPVVLPREPEQVSPRFARQTGSWHVSRLHAAWHTVDLAHPDAPALDILAHVLGAGRSSRLVDRIKEKKKLVFSIDAWSYTPGQPGLFGVSANFPPEHEDRVLEAIEEEIVKAKEEVFSASDIEKARR
ncbi:MAG: pitrilysin family protein, partial [Verrucomicrobiota bacterium]